MAISAPASASASAPVARQDQSKADACKFENGYSKLSPKVKDKLAKKGFPNAIDILDSGRQDLLDLLKAQVVGDQSCQCSRCLENHGSTGKNNPGL